MENLLESPLLTMVQTINKPAIYLRGKHFVLNKFTEKISGYKDSEIIDLASWFRTIYPENHEEVERMYEMALKSGFSYPVDVKILTKAGKERFIRFTGYKNADEIIWLLADITAILESQEASLKELRAKTNALKEIKLLKARQVSENNKLKKTNKELEDFAYIASHDLKEPLRKISAFSTQLKEKYVTQLDEKGIFYIDRLTNASSRMQKLIDDLLQYSRVSRIQITEKAVLDVNELINYTEFKLERFINEKKAVIIKKNILPIFGNESLIQSLFQNLVNNGIKFHQKDVLPIIEIDSEVVTIRRRDFVHYSIKDNGIGIEERFLERVFNIFERLHGRDEYEGTGIGLAIAQRVIEKHKGKISIESEIGAGTTFHLYLPTNDNA